MEIIITIQRWRKEFELEEIPCSEITRVVDISRWENVSDARVGEAVDEILEDVPVGDYAVVTHKWEFLQS